MAAHGLVVHGHFYQPPRENPWTETVPVEPSAAPAHDWNERIAEECYRPNTAARIVDDHGLVLGIVNNFEHLSFNLGPTLAAWLEGHRPTVYRAIVDADARAGTAIAQAFHHSILPLCSPRDLRTQVRWGIADFEHRFGRRPAGMWLPECAVNDDVLAVLAEEGVAFTILAPGQAAQPVDPTVPYRWEHPDGERSVTIVFYDGGLSHDVAFGMATVHASVLVDRAEHAIGQGKGSFVCVATDGETFGHHHHFAERAIAYALGVEAPVARRHPLAATCSRSTRPPHQARAHHESAWSCAHGVGRWWPTAAATPAASPAGPSSGAPRCVHALDLLRDHAATCSSGAGPRSFMTRGPRGRLRGRPPGRDTVWTTFTA
jgi:alpha-amylase/alpha-mannosidase (GH57 family)